MKLKKSYIKIVVALALVSGGAYFYKSFSKEKLKEDAVDIATSLGGKAVNYGKEKIQNLQKKQNNTGAVLSVDVDEPTPGTQTVAAGAVLSGNDEIIEEVVLDNLVSVNRTSLVPVEHPEYISIDDLSIRSADADKMLEMAITTLDVDRFKFLIDSGVSVEFTEDKVCIQSKSLNKPYYTATFSQKVIPEGVKDLKANFFEFYIDKTYTTECSKLFLFKLAPFLKANYTDFETLANPKDLYTNWTRYATQKYSEHIQEKGLTYDHEELRSVIKKENQYGVDLYNTYYEDEKLKHTQKYLKAKEIFDILITKIPRKDYYQFLELIYDNELSYEIRYKLLELYMDYINDPVYHENREFFINLYKQAGIELYEELKDKQRVKSYAQRLSAFNYSSFFNNLFINLHKAEVNTFNYNKTLESYVKNDGGQYPEIKDIVLPFPTVQQLSEGNIDYTVKGLSDKVIKESFIDSQLTGVDINLYLANNEIRLIHKLKDYDKEVLNATIDCAVISCSDNIRGGTSLHLLVDSSGSTLYRSTRPNAILVRYLLNEGLASPNALSASGITAHSLLLDKMKHHNQINSNTDKYTEIEKAFMNKSYD